MKRKKADKITVRLLGDKSLRQIAEPVTEITDETRSLVSGMLDVMYENEGIGLAAPQVGVSERIFVIDPFWYREGEQKNPHVFINPKFKEFEGSVQAEEGCLSLPGVYEKVNRAKKVVVEAFNEKSEKFELEADGLFGRAIQHEYDHLEGILFIDKISKLRKVFIKKQLKELESTTDKNGENLKIS